MKRPINLLWSQSLKHVMDQQKINVGTLSERVGVSEQAIYKWLSGGTITLSSLERVAFALDVPPWRLLGGQVGSRAGIDTWFEARHRSEA